MKKAFHTLRKAPKVKKVQFNRFKDEVPPLLKVSIAYLEQNGNFFLDCFEKLFCLYFL